MNAMKQFYRRYRLSLLRLKLIWLSGAAQQLNQYYHALYCRVFSRMLHRISVLECRYEQERRRYFDAKKPKGAFQHESDH